MLFERDNNPGRITNFSDEDLETLYAHEIQEAKDFLKTNPSLLQKEVFLATEADTFLRGDLLSATTFTVEGVLVEGGDLNYISVGITAEVFGISAVGFDVRNVLHNGVQYFSEGFNERQLAQIYLGREWAIRGRNYVKGLD